MNQKTTDMNNFYLARTRLLQWQPTAMHIRLEKGKCPDCKLTGGFVSYQRPEDLPGGEWYRERDDNMENCGYYCTKCQWANAGAREVEE